MKIYNLSRCNGSVSSKAIGVVCWLLTVVIWPTSPLLHAQTDSGQQSQRDDYDPENDAWEQMAKSSEESAKELESWIDHWDRLPEADKARAGFAPGFDRRGLDYRLAERRMYDLLALRVLQQDAASRKQFLDGLATSELPEATRAKLNRSIERLEPMIQAGVDQLKADQAAADQAATQAEEATETAIFEVILEAL